MAGSVITVVRPIFSTFLLRVTLSLVSIEKHPDREVELEGGHKLRLESHTDRRFGTPKTIVTAKRKLPDGEEVDSATASFAHRGESLHPVHVQVEPVMQRKGVATHMYRAAEGHTGKKVAPGDTQTVDGKKFSESYRARRDVAKALQRLLRLLA